MVALFFGRSRPDGGSEADWHHFLDRVIAPALSHGFTVSNASGGLVKSARQADP